MVALSEPLGSSARSSIVETVKVPVPLLSIDTSRKPVWPLAAKSPLSETCTLTVMASDGAGLAVSVNLAAPPSDTLTPPEMLTVGTITGRSSSINTIRPSPLRLPAIRPAIPEACSLMVPHASEAGTLTVTVSSSASRSSTAVTASVAEVALLPLSGPVKTTVLVAASNLTPAGLPESERVKSVPGWPPENASGTRRLSPLINPRFASAPLSVRRSAAASPGSPSVARSSVTLSSTSTSALTAKLRICSGPAVPPRSGLG